MVLNFGSHNLWIFSALVLRISRMVVFLLCILFAVLFSLPTPFPPVVEHRRFDKYKYQLCAFFICVVYVFTKRKLIVKYYAQVFQTRLKVKIYLSYIHIKFFPFFSLSS